jgi:hypothetical protein
MRAAKGMASPPLSCTPLASSGPSYYTRSGLAAVHPNARAARPVYALVRYHQSYDPISGSTPSPVDENNCPHVRTYDDRERVSDAAHVCDAPARVVPGSGAPFPELLLRQSTRA